MKAVCTWKEKDGTVVGPLNCDTDVSAVGMDDKVFFTIKVDLGDISTPVLKGVSIDTANRMADYMQHSNLYDKPVEGMDEPILPDGENMMYSWFGGKLHMIVRDTVSDRMEYIITHIQMTKNDARKLAHDVHESISFLEDHGGCLDSPLEITPEDIRKYPRMMKQIMDFNSILVRLI